MDIITLLTDFGLTDEYVGVMKGVILSRHPQARIVDITHHIPAQSVEAGAFILEASHRFFPQGAVHVAVVDPGVGSQRNILAAHCNGHFFLAPDNGLLWPILAACPTAEIVRVSNATLFLPEVSATFHGRDIFAPVAAILARDKNLASLGPALLLGDIKKIPPAPAQDREGCLVGCILWTDHFGNLTTNISQTRLMQFAGDDFEKSLSIQVGSSIIQGLVRTYADASPGSAAALIGSRGCLEIALPQGDAATHLGVCAGAEVVIQKSRPGQG